MIKVRAFLLSMLLVVFMLPQAAVASTGDSDISQEAGIGPDSMLYIFDKLLDNLGVALAFDSGEKAERALRIAGERLAESKRMIELGKLDAARVAQAEHAHALGIVEDAILKLKAKSDDASLMREVELEVELESHEGEIKAARGEIAGNNLLEKRQDALNIMVPIQIRAAEARAGIARSADSSSSVTSDTGRRNDELLSGTILHSASRRGNGPVSVEARLFGTSSRIRIEVESSTSSSDHDAVTVELLETVKLSKADIERLLDIKIENHPDELRERIRARARQKDGMTRTELRLEFPLNTVDRQAIVDGIFERLNGMTASSIGNAMTLEVERGRTSRGIRDRHDDNDVRGRDGENEIRGRDNEAELRGRDSENEVRGSQAEAELRGRDSENEDIRGNSDEDEIRGRDSEPELRGRESELRGREAEGEAPRGSDSSDDDDGESNYRRGSGKRGGGE